MMTTKVFQRVLATFFVVAALFLANGLNNVANAARVHLYDGVSVDKILKIIKEKGEIYNFRIGNKYYYTSTSGHRCCRSYFGNSDKSGITFILGDKDTVSSAFVFVNIDDAQKDDIMAAYAMSINTVTELTKLSDAEREKFGFDMMTYVNKSIKEATENDEVVNMDKTFSIWSAKSKRYIDVRIFSDRSDETINYHIFAHT